MIIASSIFVSAFTLYLAIDVVKSVGNDIRVRIGVKSLLLALRSFLFFAYWYYQLTREDPDYFYPSYEDFLLPVLVGSNMMIGIVCTIILIILSLGYGAGYKKLYPLISRILGYFLLSGVGSSILIYYFQPDLATQKSLYYVVAAVLIVYDLQYL